MARRHIQRGKMPPCGVWWSEVGARMMFSAGSLQPVVELLRVLDWKTERNKYLTFTGPPSKGLDVLPTLVNYDWHGWYFSITYQNYKAHFLIHVIIP